METLTRDAGLPPSICPAIRPEADGRPHAIVVGSGFGGLAAAVRLGARGYRVTVLEKRDQFGGRAGVWRQDGFTFDAGPTIVTAPFLFEELWALCGKRLADDVELRPVTPFYAIRFADGETFRYTGDAQGMRDEVARFSPATSPATSDSWPRVRVSSASDSSSSATCRFHRGATWRASCRIW